METIELIFVTDVNAWIYLHNTSLLLRQSLSLQSKALAKAGEVGCRPDRKESPANVGQMEKRQMPE